MEFSSKWPSSKSLIQNSLKGDSLKAQKREFHGWNHLDPLQMPKIPTQLNF